MLRFAPFIAVAALTQAVTALGQEPDKLLHSVPPGIGQNDPDRHRFRINPKNDPLRSFEGDSERWMIETWPGEPGLGEPALAPAKCSDARATHGAHSLAIDVELPRASSVSKHACIGAYKYISYDVYIPKDAPLRVRSIFFVKDKDGHWFQALSGRPYLREPDGDYSPGPSPYRLIPGRWNTVVVDLREATTTLQPQGHMARWQERFAFEADYLGFAVFGDTDYEGTVYLDNLRGWKLADRVDPLVIRNLQFPRAGTRQYDLFEVAFDLNRDFARPFDPDVVSVGATFTAPSGRETPALGFFYQDYSRRLAVTGEQMVPKGTAAWKLRFAPSEIGTHTFKLEVSVGEESLQTRERTFEVLPSSHPGYVRVSKKDKRCLEFENGEPYYPIGHNVRSPNDPRCSLVLGWPLRPDEGTYTYDRILESMAASGENLVEIWMASWWVAIEWSRDWKNYHGIGHYNLANAWRLDYLLAKARKLGLRVQLVIDNHGKYSAFCDPEWNTSPYNRANQWSPGGELRRPEEFFSSKWAKEYYKRKTRYIFARWGWDPTIMGFEVISELNLTGSRGGFAGRRGRPDTPGQPLGLQHHWHKEMIAHFRKIDPGRHLYTTHYSGDYNEVDPVMARLNEIGYVVGDGYRGDSHPYARLAHASAVALEKYGKPFIITEYGGGWNGTSDPALEADLHSGLWSTYMTSAAGSPLLWWFDFIDRKNLYWHYSAFRNYAKGEDRRDPDLKMRTPNFERRPDGIEVAAMSYMSKVRGYAWVYAVWPMSNYPVSPIKVSKVRVRFDDVANGRWQVQFWDTVIGEVTETRDVEVKDGRLRLDFPTFGNDIALKLFHSSYDRPKRPKVRTRSAPTSDTMPGARSRLSGPQKRSDENDTRSFIRNWAVLGPFDCAPSMGEKAPLMQFATDEDRLKPLAGRTVSGKRWRMLSKEGISDSGRIDLKKTYGDEDNRVAYAAAELWCDSEMRDLVMLVGSDDTVRVYVNGRSVHIFQGGRGAEADQDRIEGIRLREGPNTVIVKCGNMGSDWAFYARFTSKDGRPLVVRPFAER